MQALNDPGRYDTYTKLQFIIEKLEIRFNLISDKHIGDKFTITVRTKLAIDEIVLIFLQ